MRNLIRRILFRQEDIFVYTDQAEVPRHVTKVHFEEGVKMIEDFAFNGCTKLTIITIPSSVEDIRVATFWGCRSLKRIDLPSGLITIGESAFSTCTSLEHIDLPSGLTTIGRSAFEYCESLKHLDLPPGLTRIESSAFNGCTSLSSIVIPVRTQIHSDSFDEHTTVIHSNWFGLSPYIKMRKLIEDGRAIAFGNVEGSDLQTLQYLIVHVCDDVFRTVLEMAKEEPLPV